MTGVTTAVTGEVVEVTAVVTGEVMEVTMLVTGDRTPSTEPRRLAGGGGE